MRRTKKRVNKKTCHQRINFYSSSKSLGTIIVTQHAIERYRLRVGGNALGDSEIKNIIQRKLKLASLIHIKDNEEVYAYHGLLFCIKRSNQSSIVKTIMLNKSRQLRDFSLNPNQICYTEFGYAPR